METVLWIGLLLGLLGICVWAYWATSEEEREGELDALDRQLESEGDADEH